MRGNKCDTSNHVVGVSNVSIEHSLMIIFWQLLTIFPLYDFCCCATDRSKVVNASFGLPVRVVFCLFVSVVTITSHTVKGFVLCVLSTCLPKGVH